MIGAEVLGLALIVGGANWAFRYLPIRFGQRGGGAPQGWRARFLAATGPAAIGTLAVASILPFVAGGWPFAAGGPAPLWLAGGLAVVAVHLATRSVVLATLAGALAYGAAFALAGG